MKVLACGATLFSASLLVACGTHQKGFAPMPPQFQSHNSIHSSEDRRQASTDHSVIDPLILNHIMPAAGSVMAAETERAGNSAVKERSSVDAGKSASLAGGCDIRDRFDRDDLVAYEWGQSRLGFDMDGVGLDSLDVEEVKLTFSMILQPIKTKKQKCRRDSAWQGMIGSGYNELVVHDGVEVEKEWRELQHEIDDRLGYFID